MKVDLRPRSVAENCGLMFRLSAAHLPALLLIATLASLPGLYEILRVSPWFDADFDLYDRRWSGLQEFASMFLSLILSWVCAAAAISVVAASFTSRRGSVFRALWGALRNIVPLTLFGIRVTLLFAIALALPILAAGALLGVMVQGGTGVLAITLIIPLLLLPSVYVMTVFVVGPCAIMLEKLRAGQASRRTRLLTKGHRRPTFVLVLLAMTLAYVAPWVSTQVLIQISGDWSPEAATYANLAQWLLSVFLTLPLLVTPTVAYFSLASQKDGLDVEQLAQLVDEIGHRPPSSSQ